ncbi:MAG: hypothetical protein GWP60_05770 [Gammaproteobacteria bacterium]|jgi:hypothetical protein|nr:hypothetical protein [Gammaproteobacteria bacterium]
MVDTKHAVWQRHLDGIANELLRLSIACDVRLRDPGVIDRIIKEDATVCGRKNPDAFRKLRNLVMATYDSLGKSIERIGPEDTRIIRDAIVARIEKLRDGGGHVNRTSGKDE